MRLITINRMKNVIFSLLPSNSLYTKFIHWILSVHRATSGVLETDRLKDEHTLIVEWWAAPGWPNSTTTAAPKCPSRPPVDPQFASKEAEIHKRVTHMDRKPNLTVPTQSLPIFTQCVPKVASLSHALVLIIWPVWSCLVFLNIKT